MAIRSILPSEIEAARRLLAATGWEHHVSNADQFQELLSRFQVTLVGLDFVDAPRVLEGLTYTFEDDRLEYGEERFVTLRLLEDSGLRRPHRVAATDSCYLIPQGDET